MLRSNHRRREIDTQIRRALADGGGRIVMRDAFPNFNDRKLARRIAEADPELQYFSPGRPRPAVIMLVGA